MGKVFIEESTLTAIGDAIRVREGSSDKIAPLDMPMAIIELPGGSEPVIEALSIQANGTYTAPSGVDGYSPITVAVPQDGAPTAAELTFIYKDFSYAFAYGLWDWFVEKYGNQITLEKVSSYSNCFYNTKLKSIPFVLSGNGTTAVSTDGMFLSATNLEVFPDIRDCRFKTLTNMFNCCYRLREIPASFVENNDFSLITISTSTSYGNTSSIFGDCRSLRRITPLLFDTCNKKIGVNYSFYYSGFTSCYALDELTNLPCYENATWTSNSFNMAFYNCGHLKDLIFQTDEGNTAKVVKWKSQTIDLSSVGFMSNHSNFTGYNSGITKDKQVSDDATYAALKNDEDWFAINVNYSRYNHDSAVATINSLPDASAYLATSGGTNTIKFKGAAGTNTDGGAINTLTAEEIAVAAAKGWTVTFV